MKLLITGSNGLLGQKLLDLLIPNQDVQVIGVSKGANRSVWTDGFVYQDVDLMQPGEISKALAEHQPDAIIHTAALTNVDACETEQEACQRLNVDVVREMVNFIGDKPTNLLHLSTDFIFDGQAGPYSETDEPNPLSVYGKSKWESEKVVQQSGIQNWSIARTIIVYGTCKDMSRANIVLWAKGAAEKNQALNIVNDQYRSPTLAEDLAKGCWEIVKRKKNGVYNLGGPATQSVYEIVTDVFKVFGGDVDLLTPMSSKELGQPANRPPRTGLLIDKARKDLDYNPLSFKEGLEVVKNQLSE